LLIPVFSSDQAFSVHYVADHPVERENPLSRGLQVGQ